LQPVEILGVSTTAARFDDLINTLDAWSSREGKRYVCTCPVYTLMHSQESPGLKAALAHADVVTADGMPIVWVQRRWGHPEAQRIYGPEILISLCGQTQGQISHYFWGGLPGVAEALAASLKARLPTLKVAGWHTPPVGPVEETPDPTVIERINAAAPNVVWVGLGSPKQDIWMYRYREALHAPLLIGVGAAFDFIAGTKRQAPLWMRANGLEWLFRLGQEPRRLWRRYFVYNPRFIWQVWQADRHRR
jgi:N-acetylglucosaminyldiphosphoundecaprenol N-acetyl-beta-D-mannosaminyltransferase